MELKKLLALAVITAGLWSQSSAQNSEQNQTPPEAAPPASSIPQKSTAIKKPTKKKRTKKHPSRKTSKKHRRHTTTATGAGPKKVIVRDGGTESSGGQLEPGSSGADAQHQRANTEHLLQLTTGNLKSVHSRKLTPDQQDMVRQINNYVDQSRAASETGDLVRARNLAMKARLLSEALLRR